MKRVYQLGLLLLVGFSLICSACQDPGQLSDTGNPAGTKEIPVKLEAAVRESIKGWSSSYYSGELVTEGHLILEVEEQSEHITVYTIASCGVFGFENGIFTVVSGTGAIPAVIKFSVEESGEYTLVEDKIPVDGSGYTDSIKELFPDHLQKRVLAAHEDYSLLVRQQEAQALEYLNTIGREARVSATAVEKQLPSIDVEASNKLFGDLSKEYPFINDYPYWLGTREQLENNVRYIYETSQDKTDDGYDLIEFQKRKEDGTVVEEYKYKIVGSDPLPVTGEDTLNTSSGDIQTLRGEFFDFAIENRLDYVPVFEEGKAPVTSTEYLFYAFALNLDNWGEDKGTMTRDYVEQVISSRFGVQDIEHSSLRKCWDFDGEKYTAVPQGIKEKPIYVLKELTTSVQDRQTVYDIVLEKCNFGDVLPSQDELVEIRASIVEGDLSALEVLERERFKYYLDDQGTPIFLSHTVVQ